MREAGSSSIEEPFAEDDGELGLSLNPLARRTFPFLGGVVGIRTRKAAELDRAQAHLLMYGEAVAQAMY